MAKNTSARSSDRKARRTAKPDPGLAQCRLVAACIPKPIVITGWTEALHVPEVEQDGARKKLRPSGPRGTLLAVPAGAVYYFECPPGAAPTLARLLSWHGSQASRCERIIHRRSSLLGEKGFGLGVCGVWKPFPG